MNTQAGLQAGQQLLQVAASAIPLIGALIDNGDNAETIKVVVSNTLRYSGAPSATVTYTDLLVDTIIAAATPPQVQP